MATIATPATPKITPFLWFERHAEEAAKFYVTLLDDSRVLDVSRTPDGAAFGVQFVLGGQRIYALNGGPHYKLSPAFSLFVDCEDQSEVDRLWAALTADGGQESRCGWLVDRFGVSWQIIPRQMSEWMRDKDPAKAGRVVQAMMGMQKIDVEALRRARDAG